MKTLMIVLSLISTQAFAGNILSCQNDETGYAATIMMNGAGKSTATLYLPNNKAAIKMKCAVPAVQPSTKGVYPVATCRAGGPDNTYAISITAGGIVGAPQADVIRGTIAGAKTVSHMVCGYLPNRKVHI